MEKLQHFRKTVLLLVRLCLCAAGFTYALNQFNHDWRKDFKESESGGPEITVFWQSHSQSSDTEVRFFKDFSGFIPSVFARFAFTGSRHCATLQYLPVVPEWMFVHFLRTSISINAP
jgi:hypothetical protein